MKTEEKERKAERIVDRIVENICNDHILMDSWDEMGERMRRLTKLQWIKLTIEEL